MSNRLRTIAPLLGPETRRALKTFIGPGKVFVKWHKGQDFPKRYWPKSRVQHARCDDRLAFSSKIPPAKLTFLWHCTFCVHPSPIL
jgi:hypothetical protein